MKKSLKSYREKRDFEKTPEPSDEGKSLDEPIFVIQRHAASHLHYDLRLEINGTLKSWAVPKGIPKTTKEKHLAILTEDHPLSYANFEGQIPKGEYGAGTVKISDKGTYKNLRKKSMRTCFKEGQIEIEFHGKKATARYALVLMKEKNWLLIKMKK